MEPTTKVDNCIGYTNATTCGNCDIGYYYSSGDKKCMKIDITDCDEVNPEAPTKCVTCGNGVKPKDGKCDSGNDKCPDNCDSCGLDGCSLCSSGYSLNAEDKCVTQPYDGCYIIDPLDAKKCFVCKPGYYDTNDACKKNVRIMGISSLVALVVAWVSF